MTPQVLDRRSLAAPIRRLLSGLRARIWAYVWLHAAAALVAVAGAMFWISLGVDWVFEPPAAMRGVFLALAAIALGYVLVRFLLRRLVVRLADRNMALLVERRFPAFGDSLVTVVELAEQPQVASKFSPEMLAYTHDRAAETAKAVEVRRILDTRPLARLGILAAVLAASIVLISLTAREAMAVWARRSLMLSDELWPRKTHLSVEGFDAHGRTKVARGNDRELIVRADAALGRVVPETVELRYTLADGSHTRELMTRQGVVRGVARSPHPGPLPAGEGAPFQQYSYTFKSLMAPVSLYVVGGDDRVGPLEIEVVESPTIRRMVLACRFPEYIGRPPRAVPAAGMVQLPQGTLVMLQAEATKELVSADVEVLGERAGAAVRKQISPTGADRRRFEVPLGLLTNDKTVMMTLLDTDGTSNREPLRLSIVAKADETPQLAVELEGIGEAITPRAHIPLAGRITDDYGVDRAWVRYRISSGATADVPFHRAPRGRSTLAVRETLEAEPLRLVPKQKLELAVHAADRFSLSGKGPNIAEGQRFVLEVVTPEHLRLLLEARELILRRRFETIIAELADTRDILAGIDLKTPSTPATPAARDAKPPEAATPTAANEAALRRKVQAERVSQNVARSRQETLDVAGDFRRIHAELVNNRLDSEELEARLQRGIIDPLEQLAAKKFVGLGTRLAELERALDVGKPKASLSRAIELKLLALTDTDAILIEMKQVLGRMLELETFNEVLDLLRGVIDAQKNVTEQTRQKQKSDFEKLGE